MEKLIIILLIILLSLIVLVSLFILWIFMTVDCVNRKFDTKFKWLMILGFVPFGSILYFFIIKRRGIQSKKPGRELEFLAIISFVVGMASFMMFFPFGIILGSVGIILGIIAKRKLKENSKFEGAEL